MCMDEMMTIDAEGGLGLAGLRLQYRLKGRPSAFHRFVRTPFRRWRASARLRRLLEAVSGRHRLFLRLIPHRSLVPGCASCSHIFRRRGHVRAPALRHLSVAEHMFQQVPTLPS